MIDLDEAREYIAELEALTVALQRQIAEKDKHIDKLEALIDVLENEIAEYRGW